ncbi:MAG: RusA family crossover junction endodeoxyribonuclease [Methanomassiliicoccales archaeon]|jgi:Holliday junction resolvase RusA-like endonuclease
MGEPRGEKHRDADTYDISPIDDAEFIIEQERPYDEHEDVIQFFVSGDPKPQGSTKSFYVKKIDKVVTTHGNKNTKRWQLRIAMEAQRANEKRARSFYSGDVCCGYEVTTNFVLPRPKSLPRKRRLNTKRPDLDKLIRTVLDGLAKIILPDDAQVVSIVASKRYTVDDENPGVLVKVVRVN